MIKPVNLSANDIADLQKTQWLHCRAGTAGRASAERVAGFKSHDWRQFGDLAPYAEDQMARIRRLAQFAVDLRRHGGVDRIHWQIYRIADFARARG